ncbi:MAG: peptide deformylase [Pseudonocardiales bacterium]|nr:peptide deformylase [Pseudonocardiales bacterium]
MVDMPAGQNVFVAEFRRWRDLSGLSRSALATAMGYGRSYVSKVESGNEHASREFAKTADAVLNTGGALWRAWREQETRRAETGVKPEPVTAAVDTKPTGGLLLEHDHAELYYDGGTYRLTHRRRLINHSGQPITRFPTWISVNRYPGDPERSHELYRNNPLTWEELNFHAWWGEDRAEPMHWSVQEDQGAFKEVWMRFANDSCQFPLYPGESTWIEFTFTVGDDKWGSGYCRAVRHPTKRLSARLDFPTDFDPTVWGLHTSMATESMPLQTPIHIQQAGDRRIYSWSTENPPPQARYRFKWHFRNEPREAPSKPSAMMKALGIVQDSDPVLRRPARPFILPSEAEDARRVVSELQSATYRVAMAHIFGKGMGIAAPQIGIERAAAIVRPPGSDNVITLLNPRVIDSSDDRDEQYEGCLSFFDVRCLVSRPLVIRVEHQDITGDRRITIFERGTARLVAHEVDHLHGILCRDHLRDGVHPVPVEQYRGTGTSWHYPATRASGG